MKFRLFAKPCFKQKINHKKPLKIKNLFDFRSSHPRCSLEQFYRRKPVLEPLFNKVEGLFSPTTLLKRDSNTVFFVKFAKFLRTPILNIYERPNTIRVFHDIVFFFNFFKFLLGESNYLLIFLYFEFGSFSQLFFFGVSFKFTFVYFSFWVTNQCSISFRWKHSTWVSTWD